jgi:hypothetical protein
MSKLRVNLQLTKQSNFHELMNRGVTRRGVWGGVEHPTLPSCQVVGTLLHSSQQIVFLVGKT